jgi:hypothetical protein
MTSTAQLKLVNFYLKEIKMNKLLLAMLLAIGVSTISTPAMARRGADDPAGHVRQARGLDDPAGHVRQARGLDDPAGHVRQARGLDDPAGDVRQCRGCDDPAGHVRGGGNEHPAGHP